MAEASTNVSRAEGVSITIKTGKGYDDTWLGFTGTVESVRANIKATFDLDDTDLTLFELVQNATSTAHGVATAVRALGGTVVAPPAPGKDEAQANVRPDAWAEAEAGESVESGNDPYVTLAANIERQTDVTSLRRLYAEHKDLFTADSEAAKAAKKAWQDKGQALSKPA